MKGRLKRYTTATRATPLFKMKLETTQLEIARRFCKWTGVRMDKEQAKEFSFTQPRRNCKDHCPEPHQHESSKMPTIGRWSQSGVGAIIVLDNLMPYFVGDVQAKREWMQQALSFVPPLDPKRRGYAAVARTINRLHLLGWRIPEELLPVD